MKMMSWQFHTHTEEVLSTVENKIKKRTWYQKVVELSRTKPCGGNAALVQEA